MEVRLADCAGFCFGVKRAVDAVYEKLETGRPIYTYGPIVHNEQVVAELEERGVRVLAGEEELCALEPEPGAVLVIRAHGVAPSVYALIEGKGMELLDLTCPFVHKIHKIVRDHSRAGEYVIVAGNPEHPEVRGIIGWCDGGVTVLESPEEAERFLDGIESGANSGLSSAETPNAEASNVGTVPIPRELPENFPWDRKTGKPENAANTPFFKDTPLCLVAQTTYQQTNFEKMIDIFAQRGYNATVMGTICGATQERQKAARELAREADYMIVIGGRSSSNTRKLYEICKEECPETVCIQTLDDLHFELPKSVRLVGITAGASTPQKIIEEVQNYVRTDI